MKHFPIFVALEGRRVVLSGGGAAAIAKLRLLMKTQARLTVFSTTPADQVRTWATEGKLTLISRAMEPGDTTCATLFYAASEDPVEDARTSAIARADGALVNIVDNLADSQFITPAIVDRDPVVVAIGTEGAAPVLARAIKADLETRLPATLGTLARIGKAFRKAADVLPMGRRRRDFWREYYFHAGPGAMDQGGPAAVQESLQSLLETYTSKSDRAGHVAFVGAGPGDPELLTLKARRALDEADVVIHDRLGTPEILELARREAIVINVGKQGFGASAAQQDINSVIVEHALQGAQVVRLKGCDPSLFGRLDEETSACDAAGLSWHVVPGITAASASAAALGQSLTRRGRNSSIRMLTGHDMKGFADHDWRALAQPGEVAAIYMAKASARFIQGRLIMHGANGDTPVSLVENASRPDQRILVTTLGRLPEDLAHAGLSGPALTFYGFAPHAVEIALNPEKPQELA